MKLVTSCKYPLFLKNRAKTYIEDCGPGSSAVIRELVINPFDASLKKIDDPRYNYVDKHFLISHFSR